MTMDNSEYPGDEMDEIEDTAEQDAAPDAEKEAARQEEREADDAMFGVDESDVLGAESQEALDEELFGLDEEDVTGYPPAPKKKPVVRKRLAPRTRFYPTPPTSLGGMQQ